MTRLTLALLFTTGCGGGAATNAVHISIADNAGASVAAAPVDFAATASKDSSRGIFQFYAQGAPTAGGKRIVILDLREVPGTPLVAGRTFAVGILPLEGERPPGRAGVWFNDSTSDSFASWYGDEGSATVARVDGDGVSLHFDATMKPEQDSGAVGSFHLAGDCSVDEVRETAFLSAN
jgi:hypothetical protein